MVRDIKTKATILIVDDDEDILILMQHKLLLEGFLPLLSLNGAEVMEIISHSHPNMVLLDIHMMGRDGGTICKQIKDDPITSSTPVVLFSANENIETITKNCGADGFIHKPFSSIEFKKVFDQILSNYHYE